MSSDHGYREWVSRTGRAWTGEGMNASSRACVRRAVEARVARAPWRGTGWVSRTDREALVFECARTLELFWRGRPSAYERWTWQAVDEECDLWLAVSAMRAWDVDELPRDWVFRYPETRRRLAELVPAHYEDPAGGRCW